VTTAEDRRLRAEQRSAAREGAGGRGKRIATVVLAVLSVICLIAAVPGTWTRRTVLVTDRYVETVTPLAEDPAIRDFLAREVARSAFEALEVRARLESVIGERVPELVFIAGPIADAARGFVEEQVRQIMGSEAFRDYWVRANRLTHQQAIAVLDGNLEGVPTVDGKVVLNLLPLVNEALGSVAMFASDLVGRPIQLPEITPETAQREGVQRLEEALGVELPDAFGTVTVYDRSELEPIQRAVRLFERAVFLLAALAIGCAAAALWLSGRRRRTLLQLSFAWALVLIVQRRIAIAASDALVSGAAPESQPAVRAVVDVLLESLLRYTGWLLAVSLVLLLAALMTGPYPWARALRSWSERGVARMRAVGDG
jgi:hypothetical protein